MPGEAPLRSDPAAEAARGVIACVRKESREVQSEFRALARELPMRVEAEGLVRALVEVAAKGAARGEILPGTAAGLMLRAVLGWLGRDGGPFPPSPDGQYVSQELAAMEEAIRADPWYLAYAEEDLGRFIGWVKRLAEVWIPAPARRAAGGPWGGRG